MSELSKWPRLRSAVVFGCYIVAWFVALLTTRENAMVFWPLALVGFFGAGALGQMTVDAEEMAARINAASLAERSGARP